MPLQSNVVNEWWQEAERSPDRILAIDEVQNITGWAEVVKMLWDTSSSIKLVVTGSWSIS